MGVPIVGRPLAAPAANTDNYGGTFSANNLTLVDGTNPSFIQPLRIALTYVDASDASLYVSADAPNNAESHRSPLASITPQTGKVVQVSIASLVPPDGKQHPASALLHLIAPLKATHWNVYCSVNGGIFYLQNAQPIPISTLTYTLLGTPQTSGHVLRFGQYPDRHLTIQKTRQRA
jgi:hypothetical protein